MNVSHYEGVQFYWACRAYLTANGAKVVWERADRKLGGKDLDLGLYRHGPSSNPGVYVTAVSLLTVGVEMFEQLAAPGKEVVLDDETVTALFMRRVRQFAEHSGKGITHGSYRHGAGIRLTPDGREQPLE